MRPLHHSDSDPGWINRKFKDLERQLRQLRTTTVVNLSAADPSTLAQATKFYQDEFTVSATGEQELVLTFEPSAHSEHVYWNGEFQPGAQWSRSGNVITVPDLEGDLVVGDELVVEYSYEVGSVRHQRVLVDWEAGGWKYLQVVTADTTDRSAVWFDDSAFDVGPAAFGTWTSGWSGVADEPPTPTTPWDLLSNLWLRRRLIADPSTDVEITTLVEQAVTIFWNGIEVGAAATGGDFYAVTIPAEDVEPVNVLALFCEDDAFAGGDTYADVRVVQLP